MNKTKGGIIHPGAGPARRFPEGKGSPGPTSEWLKFIWAVERASQKRAEASIFCAPGGGKSFPWWAGGYAEEYPEARVIFIGDGSVRVIPLTDRAEALFSAAEAEVAP